MTLVAMMIVDKAGRRVLLIVSAVVMSISFFSLGLYLEMSYKKVYKDSILSWIPLILIALYISAFSLGFGPIPWVVMGEIFSNEVRLTFVIKNFMYHNYNLQLFTKVGAQHVITC